MFKTLNMLPVPCIYIMKTVYYKKFNISRFDYNTWKRSDFQSQFCLTTKHRISNMGTKLYNI